MYEYPVDEDGDSLRIFAALRARSKPLSFGVLEDDIYKATGLDRDVVLKHLADMIRLGFVTTRLSQLGTAGPHGHWYSLVPGVKITVSRSASD